MTSPTTDRRYGVNSSAAIKVPCAAAATSNITLSGVQTIDGVSCIAGDRILLTAQTSSVDNGIYVMAAGTWDRDIDFNNHRDVVTGTLVYVNYGTSNAGWWYVSTSGTITVGSSDVNFARASTALANVSAFMQTVLDDADAGAARTTLGIGTFGVENTATSSPPAQYLRKNLIINPSGAVNQRADSSALASDTYGHDRWYRLTQSNAIAVSTVSNAEDTTPNMMRLTQSNVTAQRIGYAQIIESANCIHLRGQTVALRLGRVRLSTSASIRVALLEWTGGTPDTVTSNVVLDWTSSTYTANNFFLAASVTPSAVASQALTAATLTTGSTLTATLGSTFVNLIVFVWTEATVAQNVTLDIAKVQLEAGGVATSFEARPIEEEVALCQRYYEKTYNLSVAPGTNTDVGIFSTRASSTYGYITVPFRVQKRTTPTCTSYGKTGAPSKITGSTSGDLDSTLAYQGEGACVVYNNSMTDAEEVRCHLVAAVEL